MTTKKIKEKLVDFETAKLAKELGFKELTPDGYDRVGELFSESQWSYFRMKEDKTGNNNIYSAPTQALLAKWLREVHNIHLKIEISNIGRYYYQLYHFEPKNKSNVLFFISQNVSQTKHETHEEALEAGLQHALKII